MRVFFAKNRETGIIDTCARGRYGFVDKLAARHGRVQ